MDQTCYDAGKCIKIHTSLWNISSKPFLMYTREHEYQTRNFKEGMGSPFGPYVNAMRRRLYSPSRMEVRYFSFGFGAIIRRDLRTLAVPCDSQRDNHYAFIWGPHHEFIRLYFFVQNSVQNMGDFSSIKQLVASTLAFI